MHNTAVKSPKVQLSKGIIFIVTGNSKIQKSEKKTMTQVQRHLEDKTIHRTLDTTSRPKKPRKK
jgi:hypothetical protein